MIQAVKYILISMALIFTLSAILPDACLASEQQKSAANPHGSVSIQCVECHVTTSWKIEPRRLQFKHDRTGFPLVGAHAQQSCTSCHASLVFSRVGTTCLDCHTDVHNSEMGADCERCHATDSWENRIDQFERHQQLRFPLIGAHAIVDCESCHEGGDYRQYKNAPVDCRYCHFKDYRKTQAPNHQQAGFATDCKQCHVLTSANWGGGGFQHPQSFPLTAGHAGVACTSCHENGFTSANPECVSCHQQDYSLTKTPDHKVFGFDSDCTSCHSTSLWKNATFEHLQRTGFELSGSHAATACSDCHVNNQTSGLPKDCFGCHATQFQNAKDPDHAAANFPKECTQCHSQNAWTPATFDHNQTAFPLTGKHVGAACTDCHTSGYRNTSKDCYSCHQQQFETAGDPDHVQSQFSHQCADCHSANGWTPATFDHAKTAFPLTGKHKQVQCVDCHANGYSGTPADCYFCHKKDYDQTTDPKHASANFPQSCTDCHSTSAWTPANWDHDQQYFPIYSGSHRGEWDKCTDCHTNVSNYQSFECIYCHEHDKTKTDDKHREVRNYQYSSPACYDCHPKGRGDD